MIFKQSEVVAEVLLHLELTSGKLYMPLLVVCLYCLLSTPPGAPTINAEAAEQRVLLLYSLCSRCLFLSRGNIVTPYDTIASRCCAVLCPGAKGQQQERGCFDLGLRVS